MTFLVFNDGPTIALDPVLTAGYTTSMDSSKVSCTCEQAWVPGGIDPSSFLDHDAWKPLNGIRWRIDGWDVICSLPDLPPSVLYHVKITFPMSYDTTYRDHTATASIPSQATELHPSNNSSLESIVE